jgi:hypothetical protein
MKPFLIALIASAGLFSSCAPTGGSGRGAFLENTSATPEFRRTDVQQTYDSVYIAPVSVSKLSQQGWWQSQNTRVQSGLLQRDARKLASRFRSSLAREIRAYPGNRLAVVSHPGAKTLIVELAITELTPSKAYWNMGATAAGFVVPGAGLLSAAGSGSIAMEGRLRDGASGQIVARFSDRRHDLISPVNMRSYEWYGGAEANIEIWAKKGAEFLHAKPGATVSRSSAVTLNPF